MIEAVILFRNPTNGCVGFISDGDENNSISVFKSEDEAVEFAAKHWLLGTNDWPFQVVELDELMT